MPYIMKIVRLRPATRARSYRSYRSGTYLPSLADLGHLYDRSSVQRMKWGTEGETAFTSAPVRTEVHDTSDDGLVLARPGRFRRKVLILVGIHP